MTSEVERIIGAATAMLPLARSLDQQQLLLLCASEPWHCWLLNTRWLRAAGWLLAGWLAGWLSEHPFKTETKS